MTVTGDREQQLERAMARNHYSGDGLIEVLHTAQELYGYLSKPLLEQIAGKLRLPPSKVLGVATFYHLFRFEPHREHTAVVCLGTACYVAGGLRLMSVAKKSGDARWTIEAGRCVGSCGLAPVVICDGEPISSVTEAQLQARLAGDASGL